MKKEIITVKVSQDDKDQIQKVAAYVGISVSDYIRRVALNPNTEVEEDTSKYARALTELQYELEYLNIHNNKRIQKEMNQLWLCLRR